MGLNLVPLGMNGFRLNHSFVLSELLASVTGFYTTLNRRL